MEVADAEPLDRLLQLLAHRLRAARHHEALLDELLPREVLEDLLRLLAELGYPCNRDEAAECISVVRHDPRQHLLLAEVDGDACGLISPYTLYSVVHGSELARITGLVVLPDSQGRGIGRRLLREVESISRRCGVRWPSVRRLRSGRSNRRQPQPRTQPSGGRVVEHDRSTMQFGEVADDGEP